MLNIEEVVDRVGFQLSEILQEVEKEKEEPPRLSQPTYPLCSHEEESVPTPSSSEDDIYEAYMHFADELKKEEEEKRIDVTYGVRFPIVDWLISWTNHMLGYFVRVA